MAKAKYVLLRKIIGAEVLLPGAVIELSPEQAAHPLYRTRVRKADDGVSLVPATPGAGADGAGAGGADQEKGDVKGRLKELGIKYDGRKSAEELVSLLPDGDPLKPATN
ncbi:hypothetical protein [Achromobacter xylosoxidans]|uniref:hypothetical protein n=1 Tax=Alcaligenes xylosoxydans xylosoxydans TaxID=85698 RepID=UPI0005F917A1|nr:hypothetical protein [Achromobacter xylosoxidans]